MYSLMSAGLHEENGLDPETSLRMYQTYVLPVLLYGMEVILPRQRPGVAQWLGRRISDQGVSGSNPGRCTFRCGLEQVTFTLLTG